MVTPKLRVAATFAAGLLTGALFIGAFLLAERPGGAASSTLNHVMYADASAQTWSQSATTAVNDLRAKGIIVTPSVAAYNGNGYVTRFEAAVLVDRFVHYVEAGRKPLHPTTLDSKQMPAIESGPAHTQMVDLVKNRYIVPNSPLLTSPGTANVTATQLSDALTSAVVRVVDRDQAPVKGGGSEE
jgi:Flp pilus assembly protein TadG